MGEVEGVGLRGVMDPFSSKKCKQLMQKLKFPVFIQPIIDPFVNPVLK